MKLKLLFIPIFFLAIHALAQTGPLTRTRHGYQKPYNRFCPYFLYDSGKWSSTRTQAGCVAAAVEQVMTYYRRPVVLFDTLKGWETKNYTINSILPGETIQTNGIRDVYTEADDSSATHEVARLMYLIAVAARMNFGLEASGSSLRRLVEPMQRAFGYKYVHFVENYDYTAPQWHELLRREIDAGRPVTYAGYTQHFNGHAFVIDGYNDEGLFHVNWGYDGSYNGWFDLDRLSFAEPVDEPTASGQSEGFFCNHQALLLCPDSVDEALPEPLKKTGNEMVISNVVFEEEPLTARYTPVRITVTNTTDMELTGRFEFFTNLPTDTALFVQGDYNGLAGITLAGGESRELRMHLQFDEAGDRIFRASPDDSTLLCAIPISIDSAPAAEIFYDEPLISFPEPGVVQIVQTYRVGIDGGRAGTTMTYEIYESDDANNARHYYHLYAHPGAAASDTVTFCNLTPGKTYSYRLRHPWKIRHEEAFTMPIDIETGINAVEHSMVNGQRSTVNGQCSTVNGQWSTVFDLQGRPATPGNGTGIYISRGKKTLLK